ncbi:tetratricopeptide repeat protein [Phenylobacterium sp. J367]|uniref:tetratricopeptide repeat protein n=1 Tax=Phenylobacterium sp. J367 TaxID=2898435 RepID=UPI002151513D|nr:tetratricopeptide repeat protein [Phenylobacterium sp. J367]MCR5880411.1 tetratricopeptide repeat protein [Phenylobacterium sp. J367]
MQDEFAAALRERDAGRLEPARARLEALLARAPDDVRVLGALGGVLLRLERAADALPVFDRVLALKPGLAVAHADRGQALTGVGRAEEALAATAAARRIGGTALAYAWRAEAAALAALDRTDEAVAARRAAAALASGDAQADDLGGAAQYLMDAGRPDEGLAAYEAALAAHPGSHGLRYRAGVARLALGDFAGGWKDYASRWMTPGYRNIATNPLLTAHFVDRMTLLPTREELAGRRVLVVAEQGVGDELMFASLLPELVEVAAQVTCVLDRRLQALVAHSVPGARIIAGQGPDLVNTEDFDLFVPLGGLAAAFRPTRDAFPGRPFLRPRDPVRERWRDRLGPPDGRLRVGISWRGGMPHTRRAARSLTLPDLAPILDQPGCAFVSLQYGNVAAELAAFNAGRERPIAAFPRADIDDFEDLAALVLELDLVVTVQTALAHVTGAVGQRGLVMVPKPAAWRYGQSGPRMPWYGSLELFRQPAPGAWEPVIAEVAAAVHAAVGG